MKKIGIHKKDKNKYPRLLSDSKSNKNHRKSIANKKNTDFLEQLGVFMRSDAFRVFFKEYFAKWGDAKASLMIILHYVLIEEELFRRTGLHPDSDNVIEIIRGMLLHSEYRKMMVDAMSQFSSGNQHFRDMYMNLIVSDNLDKPRLLSLN